MAATEKPAAAQEENPITFERIKAKLDAGGVTYRLTTHAPVLTSEEAAAVRGVSLESGAKAMLLKDCGKKLTIPDAPFFLVVCSAVKKLNTSKFKKTVKCRNVRFANAEEVYEYTSCITGAVPPFGSLMTKPVPTFVDVSLAAEDSINFNCGLRTHSVKLQYSDYARIEGVE